MAKQLRLVGRENKVMMILSQANLVRIRQTSYRVPRKTAAVCCQITKVLRAAVEIAEADTTTTTAARVVVVAQTVEVTRSHQVVPLPTARCQASGSTIDAVQSSSHLQFMYIQTKNAYNHHQAIALTALYINNVSLTLKLITISFQHFTGLCIFRQFLTI